MDVGIPAFTPEIGAARVLNLEMISLFVEGTINVYKHHGILAGPLGRTGKDVGVFRRRATCTKETSPGAGANGSRFPLRDDPPAVLLKRAGFSFASRIYDCSGMSPGPGSQKTTHYQYVIQ